MEGRRVGKARLTVRAGTRGDGIQF
jgi:hypothetical protein